MDPGSLSEDANGEVSLCAEENTGPRGFGGRRHQWLGARPPAVRRPLPGVGAARAKAAWNDGEVATSPWAQRQEETSVTQMGSLKKGRDAKGDSFTFSPMARRLGHFCLQRTFLKPLLRARHRVVRGGHGCDERGVRAGGVLCRNRPVSVGGIGHVLRPDWTHKCSRTRRLVGLQGRPEQRSALTVQMLSQEACPLWGWGAGGRRVY